MSNRPTVATLYGGVGGGMLGFVQHGYHPLWGADDRDFVTFKWFHQTWKGVLASNSEWAPLMDTPMWVDPQTILYDPDFKLTAGLDVLIGSPPCKCFSTLAVRKKDRLDFDPQELEYVKFLKAVNVLQPRVFILENLPAISKHFEWHESSIPKVPLFAEIGSEDYLVALPGYTVASFLINAKESYVAQSRRRLYVVGLRTEDPYTEVPNLMPKKLEKSQYRTVRQAFEGLTDESPNMECPKHSAERTAGFAALKAGDSYYNSANNRRLFWDKPSWTITSHRTQYCHPSEPRTLTVRECARLMGFPDTFVFHGPRTKQLDQVGCSIVPQVAYHMAKRIKRLIPGYGEDVHSARP